MTWKDIVRKQKLTGIQEDEVRALFEQHVKMPLTYFLESNPDKNKHIYQGEGANQFFSRLDKTGKGSGGMIPREGLEEFLLTELQKIQSPKIGKIRGVDLDYNRRAIHVMM